MAPTTTAEAAQAGASCLLLLTDTVYPRLLVHYGAPDDFRDPMEIDAEQFIGQKSFKAKGKRITTLAVDSIEELEPTRQPEQVEKDGDGETEMPDNADDVDESEEAGAAPANSIDPLTGQFNLFDA